MNRKALLLSMPIFLGCVFWSSVHYANPSSLNVTAQKSDSKIASSDRIAVAKRFIEAVEAKDISAINQLIANDITLEQPYSQQQPGGVRVTGRQTINAFFERVFRQYTEIRFVNVVFRQSQYDNAVILEAQGDFRVAGSSTPYRNQYVGILEIVDGRIALVREYFNPLIQPDGANSGAVQPN